MESITWGALRLVGCAAIVLAGMGARNDSDSPALTLVNNHLPDGLMSVPADMTFSPDSKTLAVANRDATIRLWDMPTGKERAALKGHMRPVNSCAFSPDGSILASVGQDRLRLWNPLTGQELPSPMPEESNTRGVVFSPDGKLIATRGLTSKIDLWSVEKTAGAGSLDAGGGPVTAIQFSPDGKRFVSGHYDRTVTVWDLAERRSIEKYTFETDYPASLLFARDASSLLIGLNDGSVFRVSPGRADAPGEVKPGAGSTAFFELTGDRRTLAIAGPDPATRQEIHIDVAGMKRTRVESHSHLELRDSTTLAVKRTISVSRIRELGTITAMAISPTANG